MQSKLTIKDSSSSFIVGFIISQISVLAATIITMTVCKFFDSNFDSAAFLKTGVGYLILSLALYTSILIYFFFINKSKENKITGKISLKKLSLYILIATISYFCLSPIVNCFNILLIRCGVSISELSYPLTTRNYFISIISLVLAPAICEELLFRGLIFSGLKKHGKIFSISISAIMFCLFHMSLTQTVYPILMGLLFGVIMFYEGNIYYCIAVHATNNLISLTMSYFKVNLAFNHWTYYLLAICLALIFIVTIIALMIKNKHEKTKLNKSDKIYLFSSLGIMAIFWLLTNLI